VLTGSLQGQVFPVERASCTIGRNSDADLRFDPADDLDVSGRHALVGRLADGSWIVRDLGSTNGTFLNGRRIDDDAPLANGDRISFGETGPVVEFRSSVPASPLATSLSTGGRRSALDASPATVVIRSNRARLFFGSNPPNALRLALFSTAMIAVFAIAIYTQRERAAALEGERVILEQRIDSLTLAGERSIQSLLGEVLELTDALRETQEQVRQASARLDQARERGDLAEVARLRAQLASATTALGQRQAAAGLDFTAIQRANRPAVAVIYVEGSDGRVSTGTAFAVRPDATLITSRHVVAGEDGRQQPRRIAIQFSDSDQVWPARILRVSEVADLAVVKIDNILGDVPTVGFFNLRADTLSVGGVVASIGFPTGRGLSPEASYDRGEVAPLLSAGIVTAVTPERIEFQGYGAAGASGSPVFDATGSMIAILFGGLVDSTHPTLIAVPASAAVALLESLP